MGLDLKGKRILVTGGSMGLGLATAQRLAHLGARVVVAGRGVEALDVALGELVGEGHERLCLDVSHRAGWAPAMEQIDAGGALDGLVTAAGVLGPVGSLDAVSADEVAATIGINLVGTALALHHALPRLRATEGRAVTFSGGGGSAPLVRFDAYAASKAGVVRLTENVAADGAIEVNCVAPGFIATRMHEGTLAAGPEAAGAAYYERTQAQLDEGGFPASEAAELVAYLIGPESRGITGRLISAQWDPWREEAFRARLRDDPDLAKLRRIDEQFFTRRRD
jgi:NAD(P)-dependent dehydrogenase (short-subunit alcohol dehydrogenase family)